MTTDQPSVDLREADPRSGLVRALVHATMPDGTPISSRVKAETILDQLGITDCPSILVHLISMGVGAEVRDARRVKSRDRPDSELRSELTSALSNSLHQLAD